MRRLSPDIDGMSVSRNDCTTTRRRRKLLRVLVGFRALVRAGVGVLALVVCSTPARAGDPAPPVHYAGSAGCPGPEFFSRELLAHLKRLPDNRDLTIEVVAVQLDGSAVARVRFASAGGESVREISGKHCTEVAAAAALVAAVALDTFSEEKSRPSQALPAGPAPNGNPVADRAAASSDRRVSVADPVWQLGAGAIVQTALAPRALIGAGAFVGLGEPGGGWDVRLHASYARTGEIDRGEQAAEFELIAARIDGCALPILEAGGFQLHPCAAVELGSARSAGVDSDRHTGTPDANLWGAAGPLLRVRQAFHPLLLEVFGGPWVPFAGTRTFVFVDPDGQTTFHEVPTLGLLLGANLALSLE